MSEFKCKGCLTDSTHGKLQKKKDALLEFLFADRSLCLTVSAQNVNIMTYTLSKDTITNISAHNDLLVINFKAKNQIKISAMGTQKLNQLKQMLDCLLNNDTESFDEIREEFCSNSVNNTSTSKQQLTLSASKKPIKIDRMKIKENDENFQPINEKKKPILLSAPNFYQNDDHSQKQTNQNQSSFTTNKTSPYFFHRTDNSLKRNLLSDESRILPLNSNRTRLWDDLDEQFDSTKTSISTGNIRKKGLKNIGATCYMNSILQCLLNLDPFRYDLMVTNVELITSTLLEDNTIYLCVLRILSLLQDRQSTQSQTNSQTTQLTDDERTVELQALSNLKKAVEKHSGIFLGSRQQDSHEFLNLVISLITDEIDAIRKQQVTQSITFRTPIIDPITNNFQFCLATQRSCQTCGMSTSTTEIHTSLLIHVTDEQSKSKKTNSLTDLLENYFASESIDGCFCDNCQSNQRKNIKYHLEKLPRILIFYLKRWHIIKNAQGELQSVSKEDHPIDCSIEINVYPFCSPTTSQPPMIDYIEELPNLKELLKQRESIDDFLEAKRPKIELIDSKNIESCQDNQPAAHADYRLFALINHHGGSSDVGHYTSTVYDVKCDTWWTYDDTSVTSCTEERVLINLAPDAYGVMYMHKDILKQFQSVTQSN